MYTRWYVYQQTFFFLNFPLQPPLKNFWIHACYTLCPSLLQSFRKICWAVSEEFTLTRKTGVCADKKNRTDGQIDWRSDWLSDWLIDWRSDCLTDWLTDCLIDWLTDGLIDWLTDWLTVWWLIDWLTDWRSDRLTDWLTVWLTDGRVKNIIPSETRCVGYYVKQQILIWWQETEMDWSCIVFSIW